MTTIDSIVRSALVSMRLPIHYYVEALHFGLKCLREIGFDTLGTIYPTKLTLDANNEAELPDGYIDWIRIGTANGPYIVPLGENPGFSNAENEDSANNVIPYGQPGAYVQYGLDGLVWAGHVNYYGEPTGGFFGGSGTDSDTFKVITERNKIIFGSNLSEGETVYLEYLADLPATTMSVVHPYAENTIEAYIRWGVANFMRLGDRDRAKYEYYQEHRKLRARISGLTKEALLRIGRNNTKQSVKG